MNNNSSNTDDCRFLIIKPSSLGDIIHTFQAVKFLSNEFPNAKIDWLINSEFEGLLDFIPCDISRKIIFHRKKISSPLSCIQTLYSLIKNIRQEKYDIVFDFQGLLRSAFFTKISRCKDTVGFAEPREKFAALFYKIKIPESSSPHIIDKNIALVADTLNKKHPNIDITLKENKGLINKINLLFDKNSIKSSDKCIGILPGARWKSKRWNSEFFANIILNLNKKIKSVKFIILGAPNEVDIAEDILDKTKLNNVISLTGKTTMLELVEVIRKCDVIIGHDSGPSHIAAAVKTPTHALFAATDPRRSGPYGEFNKTYVPDLLCINCYKRECPKGTYECLDALDVNDIVDGVLKTLCD